MFIVLSLLEQFILFFWWEFTHLVDGHKVFCRVFFTLPKWLEFDALGIACFIAEGSFDCVQIVGTDGHKPSTPTDILVKLVLKIDE